MTFADILENKYLRLLTSLCKFRFISWSSYIYTIATTTTHVVTWEKTMLAVLETISLKFFQ